VTFEAVEAVEAATLERFTTERTERTELEAIKACSLFVWFLPAGTFVIGGDPAPTEPKSGVIGALLRALCALRG
jgi:hypothetical protein